MNPVLIFPLLAALTLAYTIWVIVADSLAHRRNSLRRRKITLPDGRTF